ncbi:NAD(P)-binding domain-containing protein [Xinfangfangia sp. D13-10-4-6]|uniref:flavin-containing monooxygenase n=1 Tax=Pseudogemmobacter hezensis TaxID=2737662 RepID=UPI001557C12A|nr:NAD(P)/FAD-dependent oxidoreductase [Pseudogemmobacter hezensis]NPD16734.1 NAD(P)-binding domain-containing protein [Pseudogemmobacter hezensis]
MAIEKVDTLVVGAGQAGVAASEHLGRRGLSHLVLERNRIAEAWRTGRWDSLVANGPAWHDRFPNLEFEGLDPDAFAHHDRVAEYFEAYVAMNKSPVRCGVNVTSVARQADGTFRVETADGVIEAKNVIAATGPFQKPVIPPVVPADTNVIQIHSQSYKNPDQLAAGGVLVVGAGSSGVQIADELRRAGRKVWLSVGAHDRPPRRYRGKDFVWWLGALGIWDTTTPAPGTEHVTIAVSGAHGGNTVDFRKLAAEGMGLVGMTQSFADGVMHFAPDLAKNVAMGDANYLGLLQQADAYIEKEGLDFPAEPEAHLIGPDPECLTAPTLSLDLAAEGITTIIWATGYALDFSWIKEDIFDERGRPRHKGGVTEVPGLYFLGLPWLSRRGSSFIWGVWHDADAVAGHIAERAAQAK